MNVYRHASMEISLSVACQTRYTTGRCCINLWQADVAGIVNSELSIYHSEWDGMAHGARCSTIVEDPFMLWRIVRSISHGTCQRLFFVLFFCMRYFCWKGYWNNWIDYVPDFWCVGSESNAWSKVCMDDLVTWDGQMQAWASCAWVSYKWNELLGVS